ncbi:ankyrin repeat domain-containing protein [Aspergillus mulundensis]|uniref:F-box domain-containing protein n=1 Tax=Aspergillus mulundensis TaxID=1810919 RepID=A0A3D8S5M5_9EURO|nr:hypothetical protein DSM5745_05170 [Aspergillus mulundensis]RDW81613.1 hypothetical protein DSM5745_05170 [Aspergillus mulundensis]
MATFRLFDLPEELVIAVASELPKGDLVRFSRTSNEANRIGQLMLYGRLSPDEINQHVFKWADGKNCPKPVMQVLQRYQQQVAIQKDLDLATDALHLACREGHLNILKALLDLGVSPKYRLESTPIVELAYKYGQPEIMKALFDAGATLDDPSFHRDYTLFCRDFTEVQVCEGEPDPQRWVSTARLLIEHGLNIRQVDQDGLNFLHRTCKRTDLAAASYAELLVRLGLDPNGRDAGGKTPLEHAIYQGSRSFRTERALLAHGADPGIRCSDGRLPIAAAMDSMGNPLQAIECLLDAGSPWDNAAALKFMRHKLPMAGHHVPYFPRFLSLWKARASPEDYTDPDVLFCAAAAVGDLPFLRELLRRGDVHVNCIINGTTALIAATRAGQDKAIALLVHHVSCFSHRDWYTRSALHIAIMQGKKERVRLLLPHCESELTGRLGSSPKTLLATAVELASPAIVAQLLDALSANERAPVSRFKSPRPTRAQDAATFALSTAVRLGKRDTTRVILSYTSLAQPAFCAASIVSDTLLHNEDLALELMEWGASCGPSKDGRYTALMVAVANNRRKAVQALLRRGVDLKAKSTLGATALTLAVEGNQPDIVRWLLHAGASSSDPMHFASHVEMRAYERRPAGRQGSAPISRESMFLYAVRNGRLELVKVLIPYSDITQTQQDSGLNALQLAAKAGYRGLINVLLETSKFDLKYKDRSGKTAYDYAKARRGLAPYLAAKLSPTSSGSAKRVAGISK